MIKEYDVTDKAGSASTSVQYDARDFESHTDQPAQSEIIAQPSSTTQPVLTASAASQTDPFGGNQTFSSRDEANRAAMRYIYEKMKAEGGSREYGYEIERNWHGGYVLGNLSTGDEGSVDTDRSITGPRQENGWRDVKQSGGHAHPVSEDGFGPHLSPADVINLVMSEPIDGKRCATLLDYETGQVFAVELDASVAIPEESRYVLPSTESAQKVRDWLDQQQRAGHLQVRLIDDLDGRPSSPTFTLYTGYVDNGFPGLELGPDRIGR